MPEVQFVEERRTLILDRLEQFGRVSVNALSDELGVSAVTIRQDLRTLEQAGLLKRTYGGAIRRNAEPTIPELSFHVRQGQNSREKEAIGAEAARLVGDGDSIALDASTTAYALVPHLKLLERITVVTNSLYTAQAFLDSPHVQVLMPGGSLRRDSISLVGRPELLPNINLNIGFFGAVGLSEVGGVTEVDPGEVQIKQAMIERCVRTVFVADSTKWGRLAPYTVIEPPKISQIITTDQAPPELVAWFRGVGVSVDQVTVS